MCVVAPVIEGNEPNPKALQLVVQERTVSRVSSDTVCLLSYYHVHAAGRYEVPHAVQAGAYQAGAAALRDTRPFIALSPKICHLADARLS